MLTSASVARADQMDAMRHGFSDDRMPIRLSPREDDAGLDGRPGSPSVGPILVEETLITGSAASFRRPARAGPAVLAALLVNVAAAGMSAVRQLDRQAWLPTGALALTSTKYAVECVQATGSHDFTFVVPYDALGLPHPLIDSLLAVDVMRRAPIAAPISGFLIGVAEDARAGVDGVDSLAPTVIEMIRALITTAGEERLGREALAERLHPRVMQYLALHALDQNLSAARIAHHHGVSVRHLYAVLEREGVTLGTWIRRRRADEAARLLAEPGSRLTIADIAYRTGYADQAHFSRSFRRWYDTTPSDWRRSHLT